jgi:ribonuclease HII
VSRKAPLLGAEDRLLLEKHTAIIGVDEVGRGALAGPVVVGGVRLTTIIDNPDIRDSKEATPRRRERAAEWVRRTADDWLVVELWPEIIDRLNILGATRAAMRAVAARLCRARGDILVVDAVDLGEGFESAISVPRADSRYLAVAAASNLAKVHRDGLMCGLAGRYPHWSWDRNKGYPTPAHRSALQRHGRSCLHRRSFKAS